MIHVVFEYLRSRQSPKIRFLHILVLLAVISQIFVSNFIGFTSAGEIGGSALRFYGTWTHIITGITLLPIALIFTFLVMGAHGFRYFYPYLFGDFGQLKSDFDKLKKLELPDPEAGGLAAIVKGLGLGALFLALLSGLTWFISWKFNALWSLGARETHMFLVGFIEAYIVGHGGMGLLHIYLSAKKRKKNV